jgi:hypothetical protein
VPASHATDFAQCGADRAQTNLLGIVRYTEAKTSTSANLYIAEKIIRRGCFDTQQFASIAPPQKVLNGKCYHQPGGRERCEFCVDELPLSLT